MTNSVEWEPTHKQNKQITKAKSGISAKTTETAQFKRKLENSNVQTTMSVLHSLLQTKAALIWKWLKTVIRKYDKHMNWQQEAIILTEQSNMKWLTVDMSR